MRVQKTNFWENIVFNLALSSFLPKLLIFFIFYLYRSIHSFSFNFWDNLKYSVGVQTIHINCPLKIDKNFTLIFFLLRSSTGYWLIYKPWLIISWKLSRLCSTSFFEILRLIFECIFGKFSFRVNTLALLEELVKKAFIIIYIFFIYGT